MSSSEITEDKCPVCFRSYPIKELEGHVNKCIFLHTSSSSNRSIDEENPRKRQHSPDKMLPTKSPKNLKSVVKTRTARPQVTSPNHQLHPFFKRSTDVLTVASTSKTKNDREGEESNSKPCDNMSFVTPLAKQVAPKSLDDFFGQNHVLGEKTVLRTLIMQGDIPNMILWGPPGCGKTSLASVVQQRCKSEPQKLKFHSLCAATCGIKEVQGIISIAKNELKFGKRTVLFMDEIHRFNKRQQDIFLLHVEKGDIILIGATTENPSFIMNSALLSRCRVIVLEKLDPENVLRILFRAAASLNIKVLSDPDDEDQDDDSTLDGQLGIEKTALKWLADTSDGDARIALGNLQLVLQHNNNHEGLISLDDIKEGVKKCHLLYDRQGEEHYNIISAMHKSIRGSDANAALYWTTRMIVSGEDPRFIARRLVRAASEDIGNSDPTALQLAVSTMQGCQLLGMPEADVLLAQCAIYLARAPKSREADSALAAAKQTITNCEGLQPSVPLHLRNAPTKLMKELGYGKSVKGTKPAFMPPGMETVNFFR